MALTEEQREKAREATRRWRAKNPDRANELARNNQKKWRAENPELHRARAKTWKTENKERFDVRNKKWRADNQEHLNAYQRRAYYRQKYGLTIEERDQMVADQGGVCAICKRAEKAKRGWAVDHCHATGKIRGILCQACNIVLGHANDDPVILRAMIRYLHDHNQLPGAADRRSVHGK